MTPGDIALRGAHLGCCIGRLLAEEFHGEMQVRLADPAECRSDLSPGGRRLDDSVTKPGREVNRQKESHERMARSPRLAAQQRDARIHAFARARSRAAASPDSRSRAPRARARRRRARPTPRPRSEGPTRAARARAP